LASNLVVAIVIDGLRWYLLGKKAVGVTVTAQPAGVNEPGAFFKSLLRSLFHSDDVDYSFEVCQSSGNGVKVNPEFFRGISLRNGWHIVEFLTPDTSESGCSSSARSSPTVGSNNPYVQLHMVCGSFRGIAENVVSVTAAGPRGWSML
jgi:hypothetical protein